MLHQHKQSFEVQLAGEQPRSVQKLVGLGKISIRAGKYVLAGLVLLLLAVPAFAGETKRIYDAKGRYIGKTVENNVNTRVYDKNGKYQGRAVKSIDGSTRLYDRKGKRVGTVR